MKPNIGTLNVQNTNYNIRNKLYLVQPSVFITLINMALNNPIAQSTSHDVICALPAGFSISVIPTDSASSLETYTYSEVIYARDLSTGDVLEAAVIQDSAGPLYQRVTVLEDINSTDSGAVHVKVEPRLLAENIDGKAILYGSVSSDGVLSIGFPNCLH